MKNFNLLVLDDDQIIGSSIERCLPPQWKLTFVHKIDDIPNASYDAAMIDMHLEPHNTEAQGVEAIRILSQKYPHLEIIAMSGDLNRNIMESTLKAGASRFLEKPLLPDEVQMLLEKIE